MREKIKKLKLEKSEIGIFWLGQNSFILKNYEGITFAVDLFLSRGSSSIYIEANPPMKPEDVNVNYIFCTHDHRDHTDPKTLPIIAKLNTNTKFYGPKESCQHLIELGVNQKKVKTLEPERSYNLNGLKVTPYYSILPKLSKISHFGYLFEFDQIKIYNMGDTRIIDDNPNISLRKIANTSPDIAMLPIIGDTPQRKPEDALNFSLIIGAKKVIPCHYGCFINRTIDPQEFVKLYSNINHISPVIIPIKGSYIFKKD